MPALWQSPLFYESTLHLANLNQSFSAPYNCITQSHVTGVFRKILISPKYWPMHPRMKLPAIRVREHYPFNTFKRTHFIYKWKGENIIYHAITGTGVWFSIFALLLHSVGCPKVREQCALRGWGQHVVVMCPGPRDGTFVLERLGVGGCTRQHFGLGWYWRGQKQGTRCLMPSCSLGNRTQWTGMEPREGSVFRSSGDVDACAWVMHHFWAEWPFPPTPVTDEVVWWVGVREMVLALA